MKYVIFYSWQSDLPNKLNRSFIESALEKAVKIISKKNEYSIEPVIDRDTAGIPGSPSIITSITDKIAKSDLFICDISIINQSFEGKKSPNPNVLIELGYASAMLGWDRIIMVQNIAFGGQEQLPFDIRGRRIIDYYLDESSNLKDDEKQKFFNKLANVFNSALSHISRSGNYNYISPSWIGKWNLNTKRKFHTGELYIKHVASTGFYFEMNFNDGARSGNISGKTKIISPHSAYALIENPDGEFCLVSFRRWLSINEKWIIEIEEGEYCRGYHGMGSTFNGEYLQVEEPIIYNGGIDELDMNEIIRLTGKYFESFMNGFQRLSAQENLDVEMTKVVCGGVKGLFTIVESIIGLNNEGDIWCAFIDDDVVRYFTNVKKYINELPKTFENWSSRFSDKKIIYESE